jgi:hypothetical protein
MWANALGAGIKPMRGPRLNGWQRIGIALSVVWAIGSWIWITSKNVELQNDPTYDPAVLIDQVCVQQPNADVEACNKRLAEDLTEEAPLKEALKTNDAYSAIFSAPVPIPIGWLLAYGIIACVRWVRRGFSAS